MRTRPIKRTCMSVFYNLVTWYLSWRKYVDCLLNLSRKCNVKSCSHIVPNLMDKGTSVEELKFYEECIRYLSKSEIALFIRYCHNQDATEKKYNSKTAHKFANAHLCKVPDNVMWLIHLCYKFISSLDGASLSSYPLLWWYGVIVHSSN